VDADQGIRDAGHLKKPAAPVWVYIGFWGCIAISVAVVFRRLSALAFPPRSIAPQLAALDAVFASHAALTLAHILPALAFVLVVPLVIFRRPVYARWPQRLIFPLGGVVASTAYLMSIYSVGGWVERSAVLLFNSLFLFSLFRAYRYWRSGGLLLERRWMLRAIAVLLGIATTRPVMGIFFATSSLTHLGPGQFFGIAFWIGFSINVIAIELWLHFRDRHSHP
jgi:hypothetical protein